MSKDQTHYIAYEDDEYQVVIAGTTEMYYQRGNGDSPWVQCSTITAIQEAQRRAQQRNADITSARERHQSDCLIALKHGLFDLATSRGTFGAERKAALTAAQRRLSSAYSVLAALAPKAEQPTAHHMEVARLLLRGGSDLYAHTDDPAVICHILTLAARELQLATKKTFGLDVIVLSDAA